MRSFCPILLLAALACAGDLVEPRTAGKSGRSVLYRYGEHRVLVSAGSPYERGLAHGKLLAREVRENVRAFVHEWALGKRGRTRAELLGIWKQIARHIPAHFHEELKGLAEGSGVPLKDLQLLHAIPSRYHCTGTAALPAVTRDGKIYHTRSLDYALDIGETVRPQTNSLLLVSVPNHGIPHAVVGWAGFLGCVTGMNLEGVSIGEMGSSSSDESYDGFPMIFLVREALRTAHTIEDAKRLWKNSPRTCGYNFIFCDTKSTCAVECNRSRVVFFGPGDKREKQGPHYPIEGIVRRCNHFVDPELAKTQRKVYDPRLSSLPSWAAYKLQGRKLEKERGRIGLDTMLTVLRGYPAFAPCIHQAVMIPTDRVLWVSQARDPRHDPLPGAQSQSFLRYDLKELVNGTAQPAERRGPEHGRVVGVNPVKGLVLARNFYSFDYELRRLRSLGRVSIHHLTYRSPGPSRFKCNETVHAEYYRPPGEGPFPAAVVMHILDGKFVVARMVAADLAQRGVAALMIQMPYYGYRRPATGIDFKRLDVPDMVRALQQGVGDIRRGAEWLRSRTEIRKQRVGIVGVSLGSFVAQLAAGADGGFDRCAFVLGGGSFVDAIYADSKDTRRVLRRLRAKGWTEAKVRKAMASVEPLHITDGLSGSEILMINCNDDEVVPPASTRRYWEALGKPEIDWYEGGHYALIRHLPKVLKRVGDHFAR